MDIELSITCWERTYRDVLAPGFFNKLAVMNGEPFSEQVAVINNVDDPGDAVARAEALVQSGELSGYRLVAPALPDALRATGLNRRRLGTVAHYTDHFLVAVTGVGPDFLCLWDADSVLVLPHDWVTPTADYLRDRTDLLIGMPGWRDQASMDAERLLQDGPFDLGYGCSDHVMLFERARLARPIYRHIAPASWWYPTSHIAPIFEQRVDAYMRRKRLLRATYRDATYFHDAQMLWQPGGGWRRAKRKARTLTGQAFERTWPTYNPTLVRHPRGRT